ncbi:class I SAM-dependent methyltransferase [Actinoplanes sp. NPDC049802]|uniref:class I SAM-dependent methyltransferase n=1 Tax=Actinoplanes sp. NPDC049802 TaxID=3154742 RepID=UPI0033FCB03F
MDRSAVLNRAAWDRQATLLLPADRPSRPGRLEWTQYPGHGPGIDLLGDVSGRTVVEVGCGSADNLAALAAAGGHCTGIDLSPAQLERAAVRWGQQTMSLLCGDARTLLAEQPTAFDICVSIFGAIGHCPPEQLLPVITDALRPGGLLAFSVAHPRWLDAGHSHLLLADGTRVPVTRWTATPTGWIAAAQAAGLHVRTAIEIETPDGSGPCCLIVLAERPGSTTLASAPSSTAGRPAVVSPVPAAGRTGCPNRRTLPRARQPWPGPSRYPYDVTRRQPTTPRTPLSQIVRPEGPTW